MSRQYAVDPIKLAADLGIEPKERDVLLTGSEHPYDCRCWHCGKWWKLMGPDPETRRCGGFTMEELGLDPAGYSEFLFKCGRKNRFPLMVAGRNMSDKWNAVMEALEHLYELYHKPIKELRIPIEIHEALDTLMQAYGDWLD